ncbi:hypothetical protein Tco_1221473 [Tanacetum coccineum]
MSSRHYELTVPGTDIACSTCADFVSLRGLVSAVVINVYGRDSLVGYNTNGATLTNLSVYGPECLSGFQMLAYMLSPSGLICYGGGSDGESSLDLLRDEGGKSDESSGYW